MYEEPVAHPSEQQLNTEQLRLRSVLLSCGIDLDKIKIDRDNLILLEQYLIERVFVQQGIIRSVGTAIENALFESQQDPNVPKELKPGITELPHPSGIQLRDIPDLYNAPLEPVPIISENLIPLLFKQGYKIRGAGDIVMIYNANYFSQAAGDVAIRRVTSALYDIIQEAFPGIPPMIIQRNGDAVLVLVPEVYSGQLEDNFNEATLEMTNDRLREENVWAIFAYGGSPSRVGELSIGVDTNTNRIFLLDHPRLKQEPIVSPEDVHLEKPLGEELSFAERCAYLGKYRPHLKTAITPLEDQISNLEAVKLVELMDYISFDASTRALWIEMERSGKYEEVAFFDRVDDLQSYLTAEYGNETGVKGFHVRLREDAGKLKVANDMGGYVAGNKVIRNDLLKQVGDKPRVIYYRKWGAFLEVVPIYDMDTPLEAPEEIRGDEVEEIQTTEGMSIKIPRIRIESSKYMPPAEGLTQEGIDAFISTLMVDNNRKTVSAMAQYFGEKEKLDPDESEFLHRYYYGEKRGVPRLIDLLVSLKDFIAEAKVDLRGQFHFIGDQVDIIQNLLENYPVLGLQEIHAYLKLAQERLK